MLKIQKRFFKNLNNYKQKRTSPNDPRGFLIIDKRDDSIQIVNEKLYLQLKEYGFERLIIHLKETTFNEKLPYNPIRSFINKVTLLKEAIRIKPHQILIFNDHFSEKILLALFAFRRRKFLIVHHLYPGRDEKKRFLGFITYQYLFSLFEKIFCVSEFTKQQLQKFRIPSENLVVIGNGVDLSEFRKRIIKRIDTPYVLCVGTEIPRKNMKGIIEAFAKIKKEFKDLILIKVGAPVAEADRQHTLRFIRENNLVMGQDIIIVDRYISVEELINYYSQAKLLLFPSIMEGFGLPIIEAMACSCPVISSNIFPIDTIVPYKHLLADPHSSQDIYEKSREILSNEELSKELQIIGKKEVEKYSWEKVTENILHLTS